MTENLEETQPSHNAFVEGNQAEKQDIHSTTSPLCKVESQNSPYASESIDNDTTVEKVTNTTDRNE